MTRPLPPIAAVACLVGALVAPVRAAGGEVRVPTLDGAPVSPIGGGSAATVLLFVTTDCPIANRYAPEVRRLHETFGDRAAFWLVYADPSRSVDEMRAHRSSFGLPFEAVRDPDHALVAAAGATVTPEAAVFDREGRLVYRGRIDDRYVDFGVARAAPTSRDLHDRLARIRAGETMAFSETPAVGCYIPGVS